jgi:hypothetical protein
MKEKQKGNNGKPRDLNNLEAFPTVRNRHPTRPKSPAQLESLVERREIYGYRLLASVTSVLCRHEEQGVMSRDDICRYP